MVEVTWMQGGTRHLHVAATPESFVRDLLRDDDVTGLEVRRTSLEDAYLALVNRQNERPAAWVSHEQVSGPERDGVTASSERK